MNILQRAVVYLKRNIFHSIILLLIIFLLGTIALGAVSAYRMIRSTEDNLWANLPAVVTIEEDQVAVASEAYWQPGQSYVILSAAPTITRELIEEIATLPYVKHADISLRHFLHSRSLNRYWDLEANVRDQQSLRSIGVDHIEVFDVIGVAQLDFPELNYGIIEVVAGANFTAEQLTNGMPVALISQELAEVNDLEVGSFITLEEVVSAGGDLIVEEGNVIATWYNDENILDSLSIEFEVIGIYDLQGKLPEFADIHLEDGAVILASDTIEQELTMLNRIYIPYEALRQLANFAIETGEDF